MSTKAKLGFIILVLVLAMPFLLACSDDGTVHDTGQAITTELLFGVTEVERAVSDAVETTCNPATSVTQCEQALP